LTTLNPQPSTIHRRSGLSLIEILVTVTLLVVIILGLTAMFNQTRKAFTVGLGNVDYQDAGRTAMDLISRELEQMTPTDYGFLTASPAGGYYASGLNFYADVSPSFTLTPPNTLPNVTWTMAAGDITNFSIGRLYFVTRYNQQLNVVGYRLLTNQDITGVGTLYRYGYNNVDPMRLMGTNNNDFIHDFLGATPTSTNRVVDGVVDFRIRAYDRDGLLIPTKLTRYVTVNATGDITNYTGNADMSPTLLFTPSPPYWLDANQEPVFVNTNINCSFASTGDPQYAFYSNAVPAYVEIELGILESPTLTRLQALTNTPLAFTQFLTSHAGQVHIFRQRVTIPAADPAAYP
jgi:hypothetical protein